MESEGLPTKRRSRRTRQRQIIEEIFQGLDRPISLTKLHSLVTLRSPRVAHSTVFRWIQSKLDAGKITSVEIHNQPPRYEQMTLRSHLHFYCRRCDELYRIHEPAFAPEISASPIGRIDDYSMVFYGFCEQCLKSGIGD